MTTFLHRIVSKTLVLGVGLLVFLLFVRCDDPFPGVVSVTSPNVQEHGSFGWSVANLGDVTGDGIPDAVVGAPGELVQGQPFGGRVYLVSGKDGTIFNSVASPSPNIKGFFGAVVEGVGDVSGDDVGDVIVGAHQESVGDTSEAGQAHVFSGADGAVIETLSSPNAEEAGLFGSAVASIKDVEGDGIPDIVVGASEETVQTREKAGRAYLFSGADGELIHAFSSPEGEAEGFFGTSVAGIGDVNGDGTPDVVVGADQESTEGFGASGRAHVFSGKDGTLLHTLSSPNPQSIGAFGAQVEGIDDVNGDDVPDVLVGAQHESVEDNRRAGRVYLFSGADGTVLSTFVSPNVAASGLFGESLSAVGDVNGDDVPEVLVGAHGESVKGHFGAGHVYLLSGEDGSVLKTFASPNAETDGAFGGAVTGLRSSRNQGATRVLVGAFWESIQEKREGRAYLFGNEP